MNHSEIVSFLWGVADLIRDTFKRGKYQDVLLPLTVLRRLDCVLAPTKAKVLETQARLRDRKLENLDPQLRKASGFAFYNTSRYDFDKLLADHAHLAQNLRNYIAGFRSNMREVLIALPEQLFYNTGIATYVWVLTNRKATERRGRALAGRCVVVLDADAQEPGRQAPRDPRGKGDAILALLRASLRRFKLSADLHNGRQFVPQS